VHTSRDEYPETFKEGAESPAVLLSRGQRESRVSTSLLRRLEISLTLRIGTNSQVSSKTCKVMSDSGESSCDTLPKCQPMTPLLREWVKWLTRRKVPSPSDFIPLCEDVFSSAT